MKTEDKGENKVSKSFRLKSQTIGQLKDLASILKESETNVLERAVDYLHSNRATILEQEIEAMRTRSNIK